MAELPQDAPRKELAKHVENAINRLAYAEHLLARLTPEGRKELEEEMRLFDADLIAMHAAAGNVGDAKVPIKLIEHVDGGRSTHSFARAWVVEAQARNQEAAGRARALEGFQGCLVRAAAASAPDVLERYMQVDSARAHATGPLTQRVAGAEAADAFQKPR